MKITNLSIDHFGLRSHLRLPQLSPELNVVWGPNGTGKTTTTEFLRWVLFGHRDATTRPFLAVRGATAGGSLSVRHGGEDLTIRRQDDGTMRGHVEVRGEQTSQAEPLDLAELLDGIGPEEFDRLCIISFARTLDLDGLIETGLARGLELVGCGGSERPASPQPASPQPAELDRLRRALAEMPSVDGDLPQLHQRRRQLQGQLQSALDQQRRQQIALAVKDARLSSKIRRLEDGQSGLARAPRQTETAVTAVPAPATKALPTHERSVEIFIAQLREQLAAADEELRHLLICRESLSRAMAILRQRREVLAYEIRAARRGEISVPPAVPSAPPAWTNRTTHPVVCDCQPAQIRDDLLRRSPRQEPRDRPAASDATRRYRRTLRQLRKRRDEVRTRRRQLRSDGEVQRQRQALGEIELQIAALDRRERLRHRLAALEHEVRPPRPQDCRPLILRQASAMLRRVTGDQYSGIRITTAGKVSIDTATGPAIAYEQLSRGTRDQVYFCLALAISAAYRHGGVELPLILNDAFVHIDSQRGQAMAELVQQYASQGNQVLVLTRHRHVAEWFRREKVKYFSLPATGSEPRAAEEPRVDHSSHTVERPITGTRPAQSREANGEQRPARKARRRYEIRGRRWTAEEFPGELTDRVRVARKAESVDESPVDCRRPDPRTVPPDARPDQPSDTPSHLTFRRSELKSSSRSDEPQKWCYLAPSDPVVDAPSIGRRTAEKLQRIGVTTVADLLRLKPKAAAEQIGDRRIKEETIRQWRTEANLMCRIPRLRAVDARALVDCDITSREKLATADPHDLWTKVGRIIRTATGDTVSRRSDPPELATVTGWVRWAGQRVSRRAA